MLKKAPYIALGVAVLLALIALKLPSRAAAQFKLAVGSLFLPLFGVVSSSQHLMNKAGDTFVSRADLVDQNEQLRHENQELKFQSMRSAELERENGRLRQQLGFLRQSPWKLLPAHVIARDPANWWRQVWIDRGRRDGLRADRPVLAADGLVGRLAEVAETRSRVVLLGDPACRVPALVPEIRELGVVSSGGNALDSSLLTLGYLSKSDQLKAGQLVVTSGLSTLFPSGIHIGHIVDVHAVDFGLYFEARVKLLVNLNSLEEVWVMLP